MARTLFGPCRGRSPIQTLLQHDCLVGWAGSLGATQRVTNGPTPTGSTRCNGERSARGSCSRHVLSSSAPHVRGDVGNFGRLALTPKFTPTTLHGRRILRLVDRLARVARPVPTAPIRAGRTRRPSQRTESTEGHGVYGCVRRRPDAVIGGVAVDGHHRSLTLSSS